VANSPLVATESLATNEHFGHLWEKGGDVTSRLIRLSDIKPGKVRYLWPNRIAFGSLTILEGDPGCNKSSLAYDIAARLTTGKPMFNCEGAVQCSDVILFQAEEDLSRRTLPNLMAMEADVQRIHVCDKETEPLLLPDAVSFIANQVDGTKAKLLVIDPLTSFIAGNVTNDQSVRRCLTPLVKMAEQTGLAVLIVRHFAKSNSHNPLYRGSGSVGLTGLARSVLQVGIDPNDAEKRVLVQAKSNLNELATSLSFEPVMKGEGLVVNWLGQSDCSARQLCEASNNNRNRSELEEACYVLYSILAEGPIPANEAKKLGGQAGISSRTLRRAKESLGVASKRKGFGRGSQFYWELPEQNELVTRLKDEDVDDLLDRLIYEEDDSSSEEADEQEERDPADWWKEGGTDDADDDEPLASGEV